MPIWEKGEPTGPMEKGMMYIVRPSMERLKIRPSLSFISRAGAQLLVGPASISWVVAM